MDTFQFAAPADLYVGSTHPRSRKRVRYLRFRSGAEAIRHAVEMQSAEDLAGSIIEVDDLRIGAAEIRALYESGHYPLPRTASKT